MLAGDDVVPIEYPDLKNDSVSTGAHVQEADECEELHGDILSGVRTNHSIVTKRTLEATPFGKTMLAMRLSVGDSTKKKTSDHSRSKDMIVANTAATKYTTGTHCSLVLGEPKRQ